MKKWLIFLGLLSAFILLHGCNNNRHEEEKAYLSEARALFYEGSYDEAFIKIDSIRLVAPTAYGWIKAGEYLSDSITRKVNSLAVDSLIAIENGYKREMYLEMACTANKDEVQQKWTLKMDSIIGLKQAPYAIIAEINGKESERLARCQCVTAMRQR